MLLRKFSVRGEKNEALWLGRTWNKLQFCLIAEKMEKPESLQGSPSGGHGATKAQGWARTFRGAVPTMSGTWVSWQDVKLEWDWGEPVGWAQEITLCPVHSFIHSCTQLMFTGVLLCARHYSRCWGYCSKQGRNRCSHGVYSQLKERDNKQDESGTYDV